MSSQNLNISGELHGLTVPDLLRRRASQHPGRIALSAPSANGGRDRLSYAHIVLRMDGMARLLTAHGVRRGERVALYLSNAALREAVITALGCWRTAMTR
jgi:acyl-CoA synthetase (AMP-forming)/AMP-acid ligase II